MKTFNSIEEMKKFYNEKTNTFYIEDDIKIKFNLDCGWNIDAYTIEAMNLNVWNINAMDIKANNIGAYNIKAWDIDACDIEAGKIDAYNIRTGDIKADNINAYTINANNIDACDINTWDIIANDIKFYAICVAYNTFKCKSIQGKRKNSKYLCLDSEVEIIGE